MSYGNGAWKPFPSNNLYEVPEGQYGAIKPAFGSLGNYHTTPQVSGDTWTVGKNYVNRVTENGYGTVYDKSGNVLDTYTKPDCSIQ